MRVLQVVEQYRSTGWRHYRGMFEHFRAEGVEIHLVNFSRSADFTAHVSEWCDSVTEFGYQRLYARGVGRVRRLVRELAPDVVHAHEWTVAGRVARALPEGDAPSMVYTRHHSRELQGKADRLDQLAMERADLIVGVSPWQVRTLLSERPDLAARAVVVESGVELAQAATPDAVVESLPDTSAARILLLGRLHPVKGHATAFDAVRRLVATGRRVVLACIGEGDLRPELERLASSSPPDGSILLPGATNDVAGALAWADVLWVPSLRESFGLVAVEGMAAGVPVVASDSAGLADVIENGRTGRLVPVGDTEALARATIEVLDDRELRDELIRSGRDVYASTFTMARQAERYLAAYRRVLEGS